MASREDTSMSATDDGVGEVTSFGRACLKLRFKGIRAGKGLSILLQIVTVLSNITYRQFVIIINVTRGEFHKILKFKLRLVLEV